MRALFIDDDALNRTIMSAMLATAGVSLDEAASGAEGLQMIDANSYDFIFIDLRMPQMDGLEVTRRVRARSDAASRSPIAIVTADTTQSLEKTCLEAGADAFISKPVIMDDLFETMAAVLAQRTHNHI